MGIPLILEKGVYSGASIGDVRIWPGLQVMNSGGNLNFQLDTSWAGDVYVDIDTEMVPRLKRCKLSVSWIPGSTPAQTASWIPERSTSALAQTPTELVEVRRAEQSASGDNAESQSQVAVSPNTMPESIKVRRAEIVASESPSASLAGQVPHEDSFAKTVVHWISTGNGSSLVRYTTDNHVNYFGNTGTSNDFIQQDVGGTLHVRQIPQSLKIAHDYLFDATILDTQGFTHEVSNEYSNSWVGPMLYDSIDVHTEKGWARFTVGYTFVNGKTSIYALVLKVL
jgi:hypothetical protein